MSEFDNNGFENNEAAETVDNPEIIETVENAETIEPEAISPSAADLEAEFEKVPEPEFTAQPDFGTESAYSSETQYSTDAQSQYAAQENEGGSKVFAIISLVCGIVSVVCCCTSWFAVIAAVAAIVLGILSINKEENAKGMAIAGIICGGFGLLIGIIVLIMAAAGSAVSPDVLQEYVEKLEDL